MKFSNKDIERALECCKNGSCDDCPFYEKVEDCEVELPEKALEVIDYYKKKNSELQSTFETTQQNAHKYKMEISRLSVKIKALYKEMTRLSKMTVLADSVDKDDNFTIYDGHH